MARDRQDKVGGGLTMNKPLCPYCGAEMDFQYHIFDPYCEGREDGAFLCPHCEAVSPAAVTEEEARELARRRVTINLNYHVKVKLTDVGKDIYYHQNDEVNEEIRRRGGRPLEARMPIVDEDGYTSFQLHDLMTLYGPHIAAWKPLPFEMNIVYEEGKA